MQIHAGHGRGRRFFWWDGHTLEDVGREEAAYCLHTQLVAEGK